jgi:type IV pilus assembly protein PilC
MAMHRMYSGDILIEPIIMMVLDIIVGTLIIAMYMPIFKMGAVVTNGD